MVIVAAVDDSDRAASILREADTLAERFDETIHVLHVMKRSEAIQVEEDSANPDEVVSIGELRDRASRTAADAIESHPTNAPTEAIGRIGDPAAEVVDYAQANDTRYIVVSPQKQSATGKMLFGSVAQSILLNADCPVVSLVAQDDA
ncbi:universal stress protein [Haloarcula brevis]|uniref:universal stress protein n=1 Tax=Haloarcula brevis TaxID=3111453 RepID=UPI00300EBF43